ncbi:AAA family ATPase [Entomomonas sp. E2T0]|uniref:AAA family ATPase n=1 Tax=Entomomonas sp. E2T0 TaxID=2930213 RepID=UPI002228249E|nr:AAA family ATPase [Entomomonas sp. E2T0]UYZ84343.1 AAA family ATPase [Entomomonas sp. E2T0]
MHSCNHLEFLDTDNERSLIDLLKQLDHKKISRQEKEKINYIIGIAHQQLVDGANLSKNDFISYLHALVMWHKTSLTTLANKTSASVVDNDNNSSIYKALLVNASTVTPQSIRWIWPNYLARGKLHILSGQAGTGKTTLALAIAATISNAGEFPDGFCCKQSGQVLIWSAEDDLNDTLLPRLLALQANINTIYIIQGRKNQLTGQIEPFDPATDIHLLIDTVKDIGFVDLMIIDPIVSMVKGDMHKSTDVRSSLQPLVDFANRIDCAILGITHFSKGTQHSSPLERVTGSLAFGALPRIVWVTAKDHDENKHLLAIAKSNIGQDNIGIYYHLKQVDLPEGFSASCVNWGDPVNKQALRQLSQLEQKTDQRTHTEPVTTLQSILQRDKLPSNKIKQLMKDNGFTEKQIRTAREKLNIQIIQEGFGQDIKTFWQLPHICPD